MKFINIDSKQYFNLLKVFILFQPILDILTFLMINFFEANITLGIIVRMFFMLLSLLYISFGSTHHMKGKILLYLISLFSILGINLFISYVYKPTFHLIEEVQWTTKISYFLVMFIALFLLINEEGLKRIKKGIIRSIYLAMTIMSTSIWISVITKSSTNTYEWVLYGYKGWFFSGNEISAIIAISFPLTLIYAIDKTKSFKNIYYWIPPTILATTGFLIGTKVGFASVTITLIASLIVLIIHYFMKRDSAFYSTVFLAISLIILAFSSPLFPSIKNLSVDMPVPEKDQIVEQKPDIDSEKNEAKEEYEESEGEKEEGDPSKPEKETDIVENQSSEETKQEENLQELPAFLDSKIVNKLLSSRHFYFTRQYFQFTEANIAQKLFGMGYSGNYEETKKTIEMDLLDVFFSFGFLGSLIIFLPFFISLYFIARFLLGSIQNLINYQVILLCISVALGIGVSIIAGHIMFAPAVSLYFAIPIVFLLSLSIMDLDKS